VGMNEQIPTKNEIVRLFLTEAARLLDSEGVTQMDAEEIFRTIGQPFSFEIVNYMRKLDFIREESGSMFSITDRGLDLARME